MAGRPVFDPNGFRNVRRDGKTTGFTFACKLQYYRGITLSIIRDLAVTIDGEKIPREDVFLTVNQETFSLEECRTVISSNYRWEFGEYATIYVKKEGGLPAGEHHLSLLQHIAPSYMPFPLMNTVETDFEMKGEENQ
ncbi:MAG: DUF6379 domain-containing protein [Lachnospiraceae bacterium]